MHPDVEKALKYAPLGHVLCAYVESDTRRVPFQPVAVKLGSFGPPVHVGWYRMSEAQAIVIEINDLIALHNKMKGR